MTTVQPDAITRITRDDAEAVALSAYRQLFDLLDRLEPDHWAVPTDCDRWDVADVVGHLIGAAKSNASMRETIRQQVWGQRHAAEHDGNALDATNALQVDEHDALSPAERLAELKAIAPRAARKRARTPRLVRRLPIPLGLESGSAMPGMQTTISLGQLNEVVYTRDIWLHAVDIERATGVPADRSGDIDRIVVHDAVADWLDLHGQPVHLILTGSAAGDFCQGDAGPEITMDGIEWARTVSGRRPGEGLLAQPVLF